MISVIIPLMPIEPYATQVIKCQESLNNQTGVNLQIIVSEQPIERYINKNMLLNKGFELAKCDFIWHCDADFLLTYPETLLWAKLYLSRENKEVVFPMFERWQFADGRKKMAEGGPFMRREVLERHGPLDETILGINHTTFPFLKWVTENTRWSCRPEFRISLQRSKVRPAKLHKESAARTAKVGEEMMLKLKEWRYIETHDKRWQGDQP